MSRLASAKESDATGAKADTAGAVPASTSFIGEPGACGAAKGSAKRRSASAAALRPCTQAPRIARISATPT